MHPNAGRLFRASCFALITSAFSFQMRQNIADDVAVTFSLTREMVGSLMGGQFLGMALAMLVFSPLCDPLGMGRVLGLAWLCHLLGVSGTVFSQDIAGQGAASGIASALGGVSAGMKSSLGFSLMPDVAADNTAFWVLWLAAFFVGSGNGLVEVAINPLAATLYPTEKTHKLNVLHAWWPGGLIVAGLTALYLVNPLYSGPPEGKVTTIMDKPYTFDAARVGLQDFVAAVPSWKFKYGLVYLPMMLYGLLAVGQPFPETERVAANVSTGEMFMQIFRPMFILLAFCMLLTASTELATNAWMESILTRTANVSGTLVFIYITALMFVLRFFAGPIAHAISPIGMLFVCSILTAGGLYWLSIVTTPAMAFAAATVFAGGITYYWPTMLGVTAERFPRGGALLLGLMGCVGNLAVAQTTPQLGAIYDSYTAANIPAKFAGETVSTAQATVPITDEQGNPLATVPLIKEGTIAAWVPQEVRRRIYPAGGLKVNPVARNLLEKEKPKPPILEAVQAAEIEGARWAFRWTSVLPAVLVVLFGFMAIVDLFRGGYRAERL